MPGGSATRPLPSDGTSMSRIQRFNSWK